jgi:hypothetical protein
MELVNVLFVAAIAVVSGGVAWWLHRSRLAAMRRALQDAQDSRLDLAATAAALHRRLAEADLALSRVPGQQGYQAGGNDAQERRAALERALAAAAPAPESWEDTHPATVPGFMPTQPADYDVPPLPRR